MVQDRARQGQADPEPVAEPHGAVPGVVAVVVEGAVLAGPSLLLEFGLAGGRGNDGYALELLW